MSVLRTEIGERGLRCGVGAWPSEAACRCAIVVLAIVACSRQPRPGAGSSAYQTPESASSVTPRSATPRVVLPELERDRLAYLFEAAALVAHDWPLLAADDTCILLVDSTEQWVVNCQQAPAHFKPTGQQFRARPVFVHAGDTFEVAGQARTTRQLLAQTPAAAHVVAPGTRDTALPGEHPWLVLGTLESLRAFHPAFGPATTESWLSVAMHEFVHIHQLRQPAFAPYLRSIDAHTLDPAALTNLYTSDAQFRASIEREYQQLTAAARTAITPKQALLALRRWLRSYRPRCKQVLARETGRALLEAERVFTYLEGVSRFVESDFLANGAQHPAAGLAGDPQFHDFEAFMGRGYSASPNRQLDDQYYYAIGYHLCVLLERVDPSWKQRVHAEPGWLLGLIEHL